MNLRRSIAQNAANNCSVFSDFFILMFTVHNNLHFCECFLNGRISSLSLFHNQHAEEAKIAQGGGLDCSSVILGATFLFIATARSSSST